MRSNSTKTPEIENPQILSGTPLDVRYPSIWRRAPRRGSSFELAIKT